MIAREGTLAIRRMRNMRDDYALIVRWRNEPYVCEWWDPDKPPLSIEDAENKYGPRTLTDSAATARVIEQDDRPVGYIPLWEVLRFLAGSW